MEARAVAEIAPDLNVPLGMPAFGSAAATKARSRTDGQADATGRGRGFDRMAAAAREEAGLFLWITSAFRSDAEQGRLFARNPNPKRSRPPVPRCPHRYGTS